MVSERSYTLERLLLARAEALGAQESAARRPILGSVSTFVSRAATFCYSHGYRAVVFLLALLLFHGFILFKWVKPHLLLRLQKTYYLSEGSLLLSPPAAQALGSAAQAKESEVDRWVSTPALFEQLLRRRQLFARTYNRLPTKPPGLSSKNLHWYCQVAPVYPSDVDQPQQPFEAELRLLGERARPPGRKAKAERASMIKVAALGESPRAAQQRVQALLESMQEVLREVGSESLKLDRLQLENKIMEVTRQLQLSRRRLQKVPVNNTIEDLEEQIQLLETSRVQVRSQALKLNEKMFSIQEFPDFDTETVDESYEAEKLKVQQEKMQAEKVYLPDSELMRPFDEKLKQIEAVRAQQRAKAVQSQMQALRSRAAAFQQLLAEMDSELANLRRQRDSTQERRAVAHLERSASLWEKELMELSSQLVLARLDEKVAMSDSASVILHSPLPGVPYRGMLRQLRRLQLCFILLPLSLFLALGAVMVVEYMLGSKRRSVKVQQILDVPVVALLPVIESSRGAFDRRRKGHNNT